MQSTKDLMETFTVDLSSGQGVSFELSGAEENCDGFIATEQGFKDKFQEQQRHFWLSTRAILVNVDGQTICLFVYVNRKKYQSWLTE